MAHTVGKSDVPFAQNEACVPFVLRHSRYICYEYTPPGMRLFEESLELTIIRQLDISEPQAAVGVDRASSGEHVLPTCLSRTRASPKWPAMRAQATSVSSWP